MKRSYFFAAVMFIALFFLAGNSFSGGAATGSVFPGQDNVSSDFHAKVVQVMADTERIRGLRLLRPIKYYIISEDEATRLGIEDPKKVRAFYANNAVYFLKNNLVGDWDILAVHEFVHALQDQNFGLANIKTAENDRDMELAVEGLIEGDAVYTMVLYAKEKGKPAVSKMIEGDTLVGPRGIFPMETALKYKFGARFIGILKNLGGWEAVNIAFTKYPPQGTFHLLHPEKYLSGRKAEASLVEAPPGDDYFSEKFGEIDLLYHLLGMYPEESSAKEAAAGWAGGILLRSGSEEIIVLKWESEEDIEEFIVFFMTAMNRISPSDAPGSGWQTDKHRLMLEIDFLNLKTVVRKKNM